MSDHFQESPRRSCDSLTPFLDPPSSIPLNDSEPMQLDWSAAERLSCLRENCCMQVRAAIVSPPAKAHQ